MKNIHKKISVWILILLLLVQASALAAASIEHISARSAASLIQENQSNSNFIILDIRTPKEFDAGHIAGAQNIDFYAQSFAQEIRSLDRQKTYLIYCRSGNRSGQLMRAIEEMEFEKLYHMQRGLVDWVGQGFQLVPSE